MSALAWILVLGLGTFVIRASFLMPRMRREPPPTVARVLQLVPAAVLSALVTPALFLDAGDLAIHWTNERLIAGAIAALVAWWTKNVMVTLIVGMVAFWGLGWLGL